MSFGERLRSARAKRGLSVAELAEAAQLSMTYIRDLERGLGAKRLTIGTVQTLAQALGVTVAYLTGDTNSEVPHDELGEMKVNLMRLRELEPESYDALDVLIRNMRQQAEDARRHLRR